MSEDLKQSMRRLIDEAYNHGNFDVLDELVDPGYLRHQPPMKKVNGQWQIVADGQGAMDCQIIAQ